MIGFLSACGGSSSNSGACVTPDCGGGGVPPVPPGPSVTSVTPPENSTTALVTTLVSALFDTDMNVATIDATSFEVRDNVSALVAGAVSCDVPCRTATFTPNNDLVSGQQYTATLTTAIEDTGGNPLPANYVWSFTITAQVVPVSIDVNGVIDINNPSNSSAIDSQGRYVAFASISNTMGCGPNTTQQVCRKDTVTGEVVLVSSDVTGLLAGNTPSSSPDITNNGDYVVFVSAANNIGCGTGGVLQICWKNLTNGDVALVSVPAAGVEGPNPSSSPVISGDGNYVVFVSTSGNLCGGSPAVPQVCRKDMTTGAIDPVSETSLNVAGDDDSLSPTINNDGNYIAFTTLATNLCGGSIAAPQICRKNMTTGALDPVSETSLNVAGDDDSLSPTINNDGNYIAFTTLATNLCGGSIAIPQICRKNMTTGALDPVSETQAMVPGDNNGSSAPTINGDGTYVAFATTSSNLCSGSIAAPQICLKDMTGGTTRLISDADPGVADVAANGVCLAPRISTDGHYISFTSNAVNLGSGGINQIYRGAR